MGTDLAPQPGADDGARGGRAGRPGGGLAGGWHDWGKFAGDFQAYLHASSGDPAIVDASVRDGRRGGRVDHSTAGAALVYERCEGKLVGRGRDELPAAAAALSMVI